MTSVKVDKKDVFRALLTDTLPGDVPIIFSNDGFYLCSHLYRMKHNAFKNEHINSIYNFLFLASDSQSYPYKYSIRKDDISLRGLSLIHPRAQMKYSIFYNTYSAQLIYLCSKSIASIRAPSKVTNTYFERDLDKYSSYKELDIDTVENELFRKYVSSYFSYRGFNRIYKLFESHEYLELEKKYASFWMLDIANCFDSIYTHTISWAIKNKEYAKKHVQHRNQFSDEFDRLIQRSNKNETNGIPIGAEISRVFAEIIFQSIDCDVIEKLSCVNCYAYGNEYVYYRYVDDFVVFSKSDDVTTVVTKTISDVLAKYNLYLNEAKVRKYKRPFITEKSNIIVYVKQKLQEFDEKIIERTQLNDRRIARPKKIIRKESIVKYFIGQMKYACNEKSEGYGDVSSFLVATLSSRIVEIISCYEYSECANDQVEKRKYRDSIIILLRLMFFFYTVYPQVSSSYKLAKTIIIADQFFSTNLIEFSDYFRTIIMIQTQEISFESGIESDRSGFVALEGLNILLATSDFGSNYLLPVERLRSFEFGEKDVSYFTLISLLYYIRDHGKYDLVRQDIESQIIEKLVPCTHMGRYSENAHLFLDTMSCPFISTSTKQTILQACLKTITPSITPSDLEIAKLIDCFDSLYWFVKWQGLDVVKLLERKELNNSY